MLCLNMESYLASECL